MGSILSSFFNDGFSQESGIEDLPEDCVAVIMMHLDPREICKLSLLNRNFNRASLSDLVWESKLPRNYSRILKSMYGEISEELCKREVFARLCRPKLMDGGAKEAWMEKNTGGMCLAISSKALSITGIDDRRYWKHIPTEESRFHTMAFLQQIWWFEVSGEVDFPFPVGTYSLFFRIQLGQTTRRFGRKICNQEYVHGWDKKPVRFQLSTSDEQQAISQCFLTETGNWFNYHVGDFIVGSSDCSTSVKFSMTQIDCTHTKGGLCLDSVIIQPNMCRSKR